MKAIVEETSGIFWVSITNLIYSELGIISMVYDSEFYDIVGMTGGTDGSSIKLPVLGTETVELVFSSKQKPNLTSKGKEYINASNNTAELQAQSVVDFINDDVDAEGLMYSALRVSSTITFERQMVEGSYADGNGTITVDGSNLSVVSNMTGGPDVHGKYFYIFY